MKEVFEAAETKMNKTVNALINEYAAIRAGRANPAILDKIAVDYYGVPTPVNQMAGRVGARRPHHSHRPVGQIHPQGH